MSNTYKYIPDAVSQLALLFIAIPIFLIIMIFLGIKKLGIKKSFR